MQVLFTGGARSAMEPHCATEGGTAARRCSPPELQVQFPANNNTLKVIFPGASR